MASRLKHLWLIGVGAGLAATAAWLLPPEPWNAELLRVPMQRISGPEQNRAMELRQRVSYMNGTLQRHRVAERVAQAMVDKRPEDGPVVELATELDELTILGTTAHVESHWAAIDGPREIAFGLFMIDRFYGNHPDLPLSRSSYLDSQIFVDLDGAAPYCAIVRPYSRDQLAEKVSDDRQRGRVDEIFYDARDAFRQCAWLLRYGLPGPEIASWLRDQGGYALGEIGFRDRRIYEPLRRRAFGLRFGGSGLDARGLACISGSIEACAAAVGLNGTEVAPRPPYLDVPSWAFDGLNRRAGTFNADGRFLLEFMERQFGTIAFREFWKSDRPVGEAFEGAFGLPFDEWVFQWSTRDGGSLIAGPRMSGETIALSLLTIVSMMFGAAFVARRREV